MGIWGKALNHATDQDMMTRFRSAIRLDGFRRLSTSSSMVSSTAKQKFFLSHDKYAVAGASTDPSKWGTKILQWYIARDKDVTPVHPTNTELEGRKTVRSIDELPFPRETALSIITPSKITIKLLEQAKAQGIPAIWIQPGASDRDCIEYITNNDMADHVIWAGECLWRDGDGVLRVMAHAASL